MSKVTISDYDVSQYLKNESLMAEYLSQVLEDGDTDELLEALGDIAKARGMSQIAKDTGLGRESLYKTFQSGTKPKFETITKVLQSLNLKLQVSSSTL